MMVSFTSIPPYFLLMTLFWLEALLLIRTVPYFRRTLSGAAADPRHKLELDGLRGLLALGVFFTHALTFHYWIATGRWDLPPSRFYAQLAVAPVAMFFIITGYLFWMKAQTKGLGPLRTYFLHRVRRLYPAYLFSSGLIVLVVLRLSHVHLHTSPATLVRGLLPYLTFSLIGGPPLNGIAASPNVNAGVVWSLRVEWMFYFALPLLAWFARKLPRQVLLLVVSVTLYFLLPPARTLLHNPPGLGILMYFNEFLVAYFSVGMFLAYCRLHFPSWESFAIGRSAAVLGLGCLIGVLFLPPTESPTIGLALAFPMLTVFFGNTYFGLLTTGPLVLLGQASYSVYLLHGIVLFVASREQVRLWPASVGNPIAFWIGTAGCGVVVVALAACSYRWFEAGFVSTYKRVR